MDGDDQSSHYAVAPDPTRSLRGPAFLLLGEPWLSLLEPPREDRLR